MVSLYSRQETINVVLWGVTRRPRRLVLVANGEIKRCIGEILIVVKENVYVIRVTWSGCCS